jgi:hypothetical protein
VDRLVNVRHVLEAPRHFYFGAFDSGAFDSTSLLQAFGVAQVALGGTDPPHRRPPRRVPALLAITGAALLGVWRSVVDPGGRWPEGVDVRFYPSPLVFAGSLVIWASVDGDRLAVGGRRAGH